MGRQSLSPLSLKIAPKKANTTSEICQSQPGSATLPAHCRCFSSLQSDPETLAGRAAALREHIKFLRLSNTALGGGRLHQELSKCGADEWVSKCCQCNVHVAYVSTTLQRKKASQLCILCPRVTVVLRFNAKMKTNHAVKKSCIRNKLFSLNASWQYS